MKWTSPFGNTQRNSKSAFPLALLSKLRAANWGARHAGALIRDGYLRNAVAHRRVRMVAEAAASNPLKTAHVGAGKMLRQPGPEMAPAGLLEAVFSELLLSGNAFVKAVRLPREADVAALFALRSGAVRPVADARGWLEAWAIPGRTGQAQMVRWAGEGWMTMLLGDTGRQCVCELTRGEPCRLADGRVAAGGVARGGWWRRCRAGRMGRSGRM